jgi:hypothetical protein
VASQGPLVLRETPFFRVEQPSVDVRTYHVRLRLLDDAGSQGFVAGSEHGDWGFEVSPLLRFVLTIPGVAGAEVRAYYLAVQKSPLFSWDEIETELMPLIYGVKQAIVETAVAEASRDPRPSIKIDSWISS